MITYSHSAGIASLVTAVMVIFLLETNMPEAQAQTALVERPFRTLEFTIDTAQKELFFYQLREFSDQHGFTLRIAPNTPDGKSFTGQMWREDIKLVILNPFDEREFRVYFYYNGTSSPSHEVFRTLVHELTEFLSQNSKTTVSERL